MTWKYHWDYWRNWRLGFHYTICVEFRFCHRRKNWTFLHDWDLPRRNQRCWRRHKSCKVEKPKKRPRAVWLDPSPLDWCPCPWVLGQVIQMCPWKVRGSWRQQDQQRMRMRGKDWEFWWTVGCCWFLFKSWVHQWNDYWNYLRKFSWQTSNLRTFVHRKIKWLRVEEPRVDSLQFNAAIFCVLQFRATLVCGVCALEWTWYGNIYSDLKGSFFFIGWGADKKINKIKQKPRLPNFLGSMACSSSMSFLKRSHPGELPKRRCCQPCFPELRARWARRMERCCWPCLRIARVAWSPTSEFRGFCELPLSFRKSWPGFEGEKGQGFAEIFSLNLCNAKLFNMRRHGD